MVYPIVLHVNVHKLPLSTTISAVEQLHATPWKHIGMHITPQQFIQLRPDLLDFLMLELASSQN